MVSQPSLWTFINGSHPDLIPCLLNRSKHAQLDVRILSYRVQEVIGYINPHVDRLSSIHFELALDDGSAFEALRNLNAVPRLRRLNIECRGILLPDPPNHTPGIVEPIASLHHLQLFRFPITPELIQLRNLTIVGLDVHYTTRGAVLSLLSRNSLLEVVRLSGALSRGDLDNDNGPPPGSITLPHLKILWLETIPLVQLEALSPPHGTRIFSGFPYGGSSTHLASGSFAASFPIPASFSNLQDLRKLRLVDQEKIYVKLEGEKGSITYCTSRDRSIGIRAFGGVPLEGVTDAMYEISPPFWHRSYAGPTASQTMISHIICGMVQLQKLELSRCSVKELDYFLLVLCSTNVCKHLKALVLSHCADLYRQMRAVAIMAEGREAAGIGLDIVRIVCSDIGQLKATLARENVARLERAIGTLEYVEAELGRPGRSSLRFDPEAGLDQPHIFF